MCGRFAVDAQLAHQLSLKLNVSVELPVNDDIRPSESVVGLLLAEGKLVSQPMHWGIQPEWARRPLINAQAETAASKRTFSRAFAERRCVVPCTGWYEWRDEGGGKQKYLFRHSAGEPLYMAGLWFPPQVGETLPSLVILTIHPNALCGQYHDRMPLLIHPNDLDYWLHSPVEQQAPLLGPPPDEAIRISRV